MQKKKMFYELFLMSDKYKLNLGYYNFVKK